MINRSELIENMYVRISGDNLPLLLRGRYAQIQAIDEISDDNESIFKAQVKIVLYQTSATIKICNTNMELVTYKEDITLRTSIYGSRYMVLYNVGYKVAKLLSLLPEVFLKLKIQNFELLKIMDAVHFEQELLKVLGCANKNNLAPTLTKHFELAMNRFERLEKHLEELTQYEDRIMRGNKPIRKSKTSTPANPDDLLFNNLNSHIISEVCEGGTNKKLVRISGSNEYVIEFLEFLKSKNETSTYEITQVK